MSTSYEIRCEQHPDATFEPSYSNHRGEELQFLLGRRLEMAVAGVVVREAGAVLESLFGADGSSGALGLLRYFAVHDGCALAVFDEYGRKWGNCSKRVTCGCGASRPCTLPEGHPGECSMRGTP